MGLAPSFANLQRRPSAKTLRPDRPGERERAVRVRRRLAPASLDAGVGPARPRPRIGSLTIRTFIAGALAAAALAPGPDVADPSGDRRTPDSVVDSVYQVMSGAAGVARPWWRLREIAAPDARFIEVTRAADGANVHSMTTDQFIERSAARLNGRAYFEVDCYRLKAPFADVATVISYYETRTAAGAAPVARGLNSFQLIRTADGWRIEKLLWEDEAASAAAPAGYLGCAPK